MGFKTKNWAITADLIASVSATSANNAPDPCFPHLGPVSIRTVGRISLNQLVLHSKEVGEICLRSDDQMAAQVRASLALIVLVW
jgi:hypothetical protein